MYWTLELASKLEDAPWPATKEELIDYAVRSGAPLEVLENLQEIEDEGEIYESIEDIWLALALNTDTLSIINTSRYINFNCLLAAYITCSIAVWTLFFNNLTCSVTVWARLYTSHHSKE